MNLPEVGGAVLLSLTLTFDWPTLRWRCRAAGIQFRNGIWRCTTK